MWPEQLLVHLVEVTVCATEGLDGHGGSDGDLDGDRDGHDYRLGDDAYDAGGSIDDLEVLARLWRLSFSMESKIFSRNRGNCFESTSWKLSW